MKTRTILTAAFATTLMIQSTGFAQAAGDIQVSITNEGNSDFFLTPLWFGFHDGTFDLFDPGAAASASLENLAEDGIVSGLQADFTAAPGIPGDVQDVAANPAGFPGAPVIDPGETATAFVTPTNPAGYQYFSFASMVIPSNDSFISNGDPQAYQVFNAMGDINDVSGTFTIQIFGSNIWDAGTEVNNTLGAAFSTAGGIPTDQNGVIVLDSDLSYLSGVGTPAGTTIQDLILPGELLATIQVSIVPVPEPASATLAALGGLALLRRRR
jgi:hypothetical protein